MGLSICQFQNIHKDNLGFLIGSGPSLKDFVKSILDKYVAMTVNSSISYQPNCDYFVSDDWSISNWSYYMRDLAQSDCVKFLYDKKFQGRTFHLKQHQICMFEHTWYFEPRTNKYNMKGLVVHDDCNKPVIGARTSLASGLNILSIMGCNPIVLIGCDCKMNGDKRYFWEYPGYHKPVRLDRRVTVPPSVKIAEGQKQCNDILEYWTLFDKMNKNPPSKIINSTSDSDLKVFEKENLQTVLEKYGERIK